MSKADKYLAYLEAAANDRDAASDYVWGAAGQDVNHDGGPEYDCSGLRHAALVAAGIPDTRTTADGYKSRAVRIASPSQIGDFAVLLNGTVAHHIIQYVGGGKTIEAKGAAYGIDRDTVAGVNARGGKWYRQVAINKALGVVTPPAPKPKALHVTATVDGGKPAPAALLKDDRTSLIVTMPHGTPVDVLKRSGAWSEVRAHLSGGRTFVGWVESAHIG